MKKEIEREIILKILRAEMTTLRNDFGVRKIALFGSFAKNITNKESDIDLMVEFKKPLGFKFIDFANYLEKVLGRETDILTPEGIKNIRVKKIARDIKRNLLYV